MKISRLAFVLTFFLTITFLSPKIVYYQRLTRGPITVDLIGEEHDEFIHTPSQDKLAKVLMELNAQEGEKSIEVCWELTKMPYRYASNGFIESMGEYLSSNAKNVRFTNLDKRRVFDLRNLSNWVSQRPYDKVTGVAQDIKNHLNNVEAELKTCSKMLMDLDATLENKGFYKTDLEKYIKILEESYNTLNAFYNDYILGYEDYTVKAFKEYQEQFWLGVAYCECAYRAAWTRPQIEIPAIKNILFADISNKKIIYVGSRHAAEISEKLVWHFGFTSQIYKAYFFSEIEPEAWENLKN